MKECVTYKEKEFVHTVENSAGEHFELCSKRDMPVSTILRKCAAEFGGEPRDYTLTASISRQRVWKVPMNEFKSLYEPEIIEE